MCVGLITLQFIVWMAPGHSYIDPKNTLHMIITGILMPTVYCEVLLAILIDYILWNHGRHFKQEAASHHNQAFDELFFDHVTSFALSSGPKLKQLIDWASCNASWQDIWLHYIATQQHLLGSYWFNSFMMSFIYPKYQSCIFSMRVTNGDLHIVIYRL